MLRKQMTIEQARQWAAQCWTTEKNSKTEMDTDLAEAFAELLMTRVNESLMVERMRVARKIYSESFQQDPGFRLSYVANIAMLLFDRYNMANFRDHDVRNKAGEDILDLLFKE